MFLVDFSITRGFLRSIFTETTICFVGMIDGIVFTALVGLYKKRREEIAATIEKFDVFNKWVRNEYNSVMI